MIKQEKESNNFPSIAKKQKNKTKQNKNKKKICIFYCPNNAQPQINL